MHARTSERLAVKSSSCPHEIHLTHNLIGTEEELAERLRNFDDHIMQQKRKRKSEESKMEDIEDELKRTRHAHSAKLTDKGQLEGEAKASSFVILTQFRLSHIVSGARGTSPETRRDNKRSEHEVPTARIRSFSFGERENRRIHR